MSASSPSNTATTPAAKAPWLDRRRWLWWSALIVPILPFVGLALFNWTQSNWVWWIGPVVLYGLIPVLDHLIGTDRANPPESVLPDLVADKYYGRLLRVFLVLQYAALILGAWVAVSSGLNWIGLLGLILTIGIVSAGGINAAHEMGHQRGGGLMAKLALAPAAYGHFLVEHNRGHHVRVATPEDPASSRLGESYWRFLPRTVIGSLRSAWALEKTRLTRAGLPTWHYSNELLQGWSMTVVLFGLLALVLGPAVLPFLLVQAAYGSSLLETVNYIEHYGLLRQREENGRYQRCLPEHSWNSNHLVTNLMLYQLQRHSDHHAHPTRPYQALRHFDDSPQLPAGYAALIPVAFITPRWYRLMDRRVLAHYGNDLSRCNVQPGYRPPKDLDLRTAEVA